MHYKNKILAGLIAPIGLMLASNAFADTVYIVAEQPIVSEAAMPKVHGVDKIQALPLMVVMSAEKKIPIEEASLEQLSLAATTSNGSGDASTISAPEMAAYANRSNSGAVSSSIVTAYNNDTDALSSQSRGTNAGNANNAAAHTILMHGKHPVVDVGSASVSTISGGSGGGHTIGGRRIVVR